MRIFASTDRPAPGPHLPTIEMAESKRAGYDGDWNHQYTPYATLIAKLEDLQRDEKSSHQFYRNMFIFVLLFLHSFQSLNPSKIRGLIDSSIETFINTPFETERLDPRLTSATLNVEAHALVPGTFGLGWSAQKQCE